jgi:hypothetical protein
VSAALIGRWLVLSGDPDSLDRFGPYAARTMPTLPPTSNAAVLLEAAPGAMASWGDWLSYEWGEAREWLLARSAEQRARHGGRAPDFADAEPLVDGLERAVTERVEIVHHARSGRVEVDAGENEVHVEAFLEGGTELPSEMQLGDTEPLLQVASDTPVAWMTRSSSASRREGAEVVLNTALAALGTRLQAPAATDLHTAATEWARAAGDWMTFALEAGARPGLIVRTPASDRAAAERALGALVDFSQRTSAVLPFPSGGMKLRAVNEAGGALTLADFARADARAAAWGMAWGVRGGELHVAGGLDAARLLSDAASTASPLSSDPRASGWLRALGSDVTFALLAHPCTLGGCLATDAAAPLMVAWGKHGESIWGRVEVADALLPRVASLDGPF